MVDSIIHSLQTYYGLDWGALAMGLLGCYLITNKNRLGFIVSAMGCLCGFGVAVISYQYGFIVYNIMLVGMMMRGYRHWSRTAALQAAE